MTQSEEYWQEREQKMSDEHDAIVEKLEARIAELQEALVEAHEIIKGFVEEAKRQ